MKPIPTARKAITEGVRDYEEMCAAGYNYADDRTVETEAWEEYKKQTQWDEIEINEQLEDWDVFDDYIDDENDDDGGVNDFWDDDYDLFDIIRFCVLPINRKENDDVERGKPKTRKE